MVAATGFEVAELLTDAVFNWSSRPMLQQRTKWYLHGDESKPLLSATDTRFGMGMHTGSLVNPVTGAVDLKLPAGGLVCGDPDLFLVHMKTADCKGGPLRCKDEDPTGLRDSGCGRCYWHVRRSLPLHDIPKFIRDAV